ncbi:hypothetical protein GXW83_33340 [Streptacidiphilus sp. PB12-B1b]|uniref:hypothetical protein n=1 Tax=Streptacidiphilus sp. PB12-B1b TaxID=2705012 RepID=UPI0015FB6A99|nr:hypothetical protein [Streptacidiphilus sp. PB12-B1b]QMU79861.1 hypothetical protein GXW83_33340 [Streptacidiphilus sp. PB12-B1b]
MAALLVAVLVTVVGPTGAAYAAVVQPTTTKAATAKAPAAPQRPGSAKTPATRPAAGQTAKPARAKAVTKPTSPPSVRTPAAAKNAQQLRAAAVRSALAHSTVADTCSGAITADTVYPCTTPSATGTDSYTLTLPDSTDLLLVRAINSSGQDLQTAVTAPNAGSVSCQPTDNYTASQCATSQAGTYTVQIQNDGAGYTLAYTPLLSDTSCTTVDTSFAAPTMQGTLPAGSTGACYTLAAASGSVLDVNSASDPYQEVTVAVFDATGTQVCGEQDGVCTLTGTAPYRALASDINAAADSYYLQLNTVSQPQGCVAAPQQSYGTAPDTGSTVACRTLDVTTAGQYQVYAASPDTGGLSGTLYQPDGTPACTNSGPSCQLAVGSYNFVANVTPGTVTHFAVVFIAADESKGCKATGDTDFGTGPATGPFAGVGEEVCLTLPTASGQSDYVFDQPTADGTEPQIQVLDATGAQQCPSADFSYAVCPLTGTAPFRAVLSELYPGDGYSVVVQHTSSTTGCTDWPQSGYGGSWGATVSLTTTSTIKCLSIPANQHSTGEMIDYSNIANKVDGSININDPSGAPVCFGNSTAICAFKPGVAYTALMSSSTDQADTYRLVRRDVTSTADCSKPASTTVGGPSTGLLLTSALDTACIRVTGAAADDIYTDVRTNTPAPAGAVLQVTNAAGTEVCRQWGVSCQLTGSASYQLIVTAANYAGIAIPAHVDAWVVGTASGWAPQCTAHQLSVNGFAPMSGTLTETSTAYCAVVQLKPEQPWEEFSVYGTDTEAGANVPWISMFSTANWTNGIGYCNGNNVGQFSYTCQNYSVTQPTQAVMLLTPSTAPTPIGYTVQGVCQQGCATPPPAPTVSSLTPASGPAGSESQVVVHGTNLNLGTPVALAQNGSPSSGYAFTATGINSTGTALTLTLNAFSLAPGSYDLVVDNAGYSAGTPSPGYLPDAYKVTAASPTPNSLFVPVTPSRILDTRNGTGAPKARVKADGTVALQVDGRGGVPGSGVTAVTMNVTVVDPTDAGHITVYPDGQPAPTASNLNFTAGQTIPNLVVVPVTNGKVDLYNASGSTADLLADVTGYDTADGKGSALTTVGPSRILDTRNGTGAPKARVKADGTVALQVDGRGGVPGSGVTAVTMNVTVVDPTDAGHITVYPDGQPAPTASNLNFTAGQTIPNLVVVPVTNGKVDLYNASGSTADLLADISGYFGPSGSSFQAVRPIRAIDTRSGLGGAGGAIAPDAAVSLNVTDLPGLPISGTVTAVVLNVTATAPTTAGHLTVFADGQPLPTASNLNFTTGETIPNLVVVPVVDGAVDFYNGSGGTVQLIADVEGYYTTP